MCVVRIEVNILRMSKSVKLKLVFISFIMGNSCVQYPPIEERDHLVYGIFWFDCNGDCTRLYRLDRYALRKDGVTEMPPDLHDFHWQWLERRDEAKVVHLLDRMPSLLKAMACERIGYPDPVHEGAIFLLWSEQGEEQSWIIDRNLQHLPTLLHPFIKDVEASMNLVP